MNSAHTEIRLELLPISAIVYQPINYLRQQGMPVCQFDYETLSDVGLGAPVIRYTFHARAGSWPKSFVAKWHEPEKGPPMFSLLRALWSAGFSDHDALRIARPWHYITEQHILLQAEAQGVPLYLQLCSANEPRAESRKRMAAVQFAGRWLARLHACERLAIEAKGWQTYDHVALRSALLQQHVALREVRDVAVAALDRIARSIDDASSRLNLRTAVPTHGDFHPKNIYVARDHMTGIDFDRFAFSAPERDLGYFMVQSMTMSYARDRTFETTKIWNAEFLRAYQAEGLKLSTSALAAFMGLAFLEVLNYRLCVRPVPERGFVPEWLSACERWLSDPCYP